MFLLLSYKDIVINIEGLFLKSFHTLANMGNVFKKKIEVVNVIMKKRFN